MIRSCAHVLSGILAVAVLAAGGCSDAPHVRDAPLRSLLPGDGQLAGWRIEAMATPRPGQTEPLLFAPADRMARLNPQQAAAARYALPDGRATLEVKLWRMPSALEAAGALAYGRRPQASRLAVGWGSWVTASAFAGVFDTVYAEALLRGETEAGQALLTQLALRIDALAGHRATPTPPEFAVLPVEGRLPESLRYDPALWIGPVELPQAVSAGYRAEGYRGELFVAAFADAGAASAALRALVLAVDIDRPLGPADAPAVFGRTDALGPLSASVRGRYLALITGLPERLMHLGLMQRVWTRIDAVGGAPEAP